MVMLWGGDLICEGVKEDESKLEKLIKEAATPVILFSSADAVSPTCLKGEGPLLIIVLDGSWNEAKRMNAKLNASIKRVGLSDMQACFTLRDTIGATRKFEAGERVQTAPAIV